MLLSSKGKSPLLRHPAAIDHNLAAGHEAGNEENERGLPFVSGRMSERAVLSADLVHTAMVAESDGMELSDAPREPPETDD